jgi:uracil-DNA glycosylase
LHGAARRVDRSNRGRLASGLGSFPIRTLPPVIWLTGGFAFGEVPAGRRKLIREIRRVCRLQDPLVDAYEVGMSKSGHVAEEYPSAEAFMPKKISLATLREAAMGCEGCPLYKRGTQTVFGEGPARALAIFVGEQPGDQEDLAGKPFVGPAGKMLDSAMEEAGVDREKVYVTNAVKHFKWEPRGKRRLHAKPNAREIQACKPWLTAEIQVVKPQLVVALGATAAQAMMGSSFRITKEHGRVFEETQWGKWFMATYHPSALLRMPDKEMKDRAYREFVDDLSVAAKYLKMG